MNSGAIHNTQDEAVTIANLQEAFFKGAISVSQYIDSLPISYREEKNRTWQRIFLNMRRSGKKRLKPYK